MALNQRTRGGQGGKKGHSNMAHWSRTEEIKVAHKKHQRAESRKAVREYE